MKSHKVVDIKITYDPEEIKSEEELDKKIKEFLDSLKEQECIKVKAKKHVVEVDYLPDEFGLE